MQSNVHDKCWWIDITASVTVFPLWVFFFCKIFPKFQQITIAIWRCFHWTKTFCDKSKLFFAVKNGGCIFIFDYFKKYYILLRQNLMCHSHLQCTGHMVLFVVYPLKCNCNKSVSKTLSLYMDTSEFLPFYSVKTFIDIWELKNNKKFRCFYLQLV